MLIGGHPWEPMTPLFRRSPEPLMHLRGIRGLGISCPSNQQPTNMYDGSVKCCGVPGTSCEADPCCILNNPGFIAQQNQEVSADIASIPANSYEGQTLAALVAVPINIGQDAVHCQSNPGATFVDLMGVTITCPSASHSDVTTGGQPMSTYSTADLARMLNAQYGTAVPATGGDAPSVITVPPAAKTVQPTQQQMNNVTPAAPQIPAINSTNPNGTPGGSTSSSSSGIDLSFLTNSSLITGLPNWAVAFGAIAALMILPGLIGGRR